MKLSTEVSYQPIACTEDEELFYETSTSRRSIHSRILVLLELLFFVLSLTTCAYALSVHLDKTYCSRRVYMPSPASDFFDDQSIQPHRFNGTFWSSNRFKGAPSPEIDQAWDEITDVNGGVISVSQQDLADAQASDYVVQFQEEMDGGYMASFESLHQLHCLNMLRKATHEDYYRDKALAWTDSPETLRMHLDHCIDILRQKLMCDVDAGLVTYVWVKGHTHPFPDFNVVHKCRDYQQLLDWTHEHNVYSRHSIALERVEGAPELDNEP